MPLMSCTQLAVPGLTLNVVRFITTYGVGKFDKKGLASCFPAVVDIVCIGAPNNRKSTSSRNKERHVGEPSWPSLR